MATEAFSSSQLNKASLMLKALAHPIRISIIHYLENGKKLTVTELHTLLNIEQSTTSHHLGILKDKGILKSIRNGKNTYYFLKHSSFKQIVSCVTACTADEQS